MDTRQHIAHLRREAETFAAVFERGDLGTTVPTCPAWTLRDLARHVGGIHRWSTALVSERIVAETWRLSMDLDYPDDTDEWAAWLRAGIEPMTKVFEAADPTAKVWGWGIDQHARFWPRRMLFESVIHRIDAQATIGETPSVDTDVAVEGIDEFLESVPAMMRWFDQPPPPRMVVHTVVLASTDSPDVWRIRLTPTGPWWDRADGEADLRVEGPAATLLSRLYRRPSSAEPTVVGDATLLDEWVTSLNF
jgi:uncharacterized protein (TIGR03083 family)